MSLSSFLDALYPSTCIGCRCRGTALCRSCTPHVSEGVCVERAGVRVIALAAYAGPFRRAILALKRGRRDAVIPLAALLADALAREGISRDTIVVPVPTSRGHALERGFDQGLALARQLASADARPVLFALRKRANQGQRGRSRSERLRASERFVAASPELVARATVVLVDDVVTTGATLADCAATLAAVGAHVRGAFVLAHA